MMRPNCYTQYQNQMKEVWFFLGGGALLITGVFSLFKVPESYSVSFVMGVSLVLLPSLLAHVVWLVGRPSFVPRAFLSRLVGGSILKLLLFCVLCVAYIQWPLMRFELAVLGILTSYIFMGFIQALRTRGGLANEQ